MFRTAFTQTQSQHLTVAFYGSVNNFTNFCYSVSSVNFCQYKIPANKDNPWYMYIKFKT